MDCRHVAGVQRQQRGGPLNPRNWRATHVSAIHLLAIRPRSSNRSALQARPHKPLVHRGHPSP